MIADKNGERRGNGASVCLCWVSARLRKINGFYSPCLSLLFSSPSFLSKRGLTLPPLTRLPLCWLALSLSLYLEMDHNSPRLTCSTYTHTHNPQNDKPSLTLYYIVSKLGRLVLPQCWGAPSLSRSLLTLSIIRNTLAASYRTN